MKALQTHIFQSQNGLILTCFILYEHTIFSYFNPKWSYFNEQNKIESQQRLVISIPKWSYFNIRKKKNIRGEKKISIPKWSYFNIVMFLMVKGGIMISIPKWSYFNAYTRRKG